MPTVPNRILDAVTARPTRVADLPELVGAPQDGAVARWRKA